MLLDAASGDSRIERVQPMSIFPLLIGLISLTVGAEVLIRGATALARAAGMAPLVIGLTVVAFGTSAPEVAVGVKAAVAGQGDVAVGNVVGSNTFNVLFILGLAGLAAPLTASRRLVRFDVPIMIISGLGAWLLAADGTLGLLDGVVLLLALGLHTIVTLWLARREPRAGHASAVNEAAAAPPPRRTGRSLALAVVLVLAGLALLVLGARWLVEGAVAIAQAVGMSDLLIGLTIVAAGTSMPEVATSVMASVRGQRDIAIGNVVGSNIFNLLGVLGASAVFAGEGLSVAPAVLRFDLPVMTAVAVACLPIFFTGGRIARWEAAVFLGYYAAYVGFLVASASRHDLVEPYSRVMLWFVVPVTVLGLATSVIASLRGDREANTRKRHADDPS